MDKRNRLQAHGILEQLLALLLASLLLAGVPTLALAAPQGEQVVSGEATFSRDGSVTTIEAGNNAIINYQGFDILSHEMVQFIQPSETARVLNRVLSMDPTQIDGSLLANGQVYIVNPAGIFFGESAIVETAGLIAAAGNMSNQDFLGGIDRFTQLSGPVENYGQIYGNAVSLIGRHAANHGSIVADDGLITIVAGESVILMRLGDSMGVKLEPGDGVPLDATGVENTGLLDAGEGAVKLAAGDIYSLAIHHSGTSRGGEIELAGGDGGMVEVQGTLDAVNRGPGQTGGSIRVLGDRVAVLDAEIDASGAAGGGEVLIGGDVQGQGDVRTASRTYVSEQAVVRADATEAGDGGTVVVWADEATQVDGVLTARGGAQGGDGGFIETSAPDYVSVTRAPDVSAPAGQGGLWLLDPEDIEITEANRTTSINPGWIRTGRLPAGDSGHRHQAGRGRAERRAR